MWKAKWHFMKLVNPETKKTWTISVDGNNITTQLDNRKPKIIEAEIPDMKASQLIMAQMRKVMYILTQMQIFGNHAFIFI